MNVCCKWGGEYVEAQEIEPKHSCTLSRSLLEYLVYTANNNHHTFFISLCDSSFIMVIINPLHDLQNFIIENTERYRIVQKDADSNHCIKCFLSNYYSVYIRIYVVVHMHI